MASSFISNDCDAVQMQNENTEICFSLMHRVFSKKKSNELKFFAWYEFTSKSCNALVCIENAVIYLSYKLRVIWCRTISLQ